MLPRVQGDQTLEVYYGQTKEKYVTSNKQMLEAPRTQGWDLIIDPEFDRSFLGSISYDPGNKRYRGTFSARKTVTVLPDDFDGIF